MSGWWLNKPLWKIWKSNLICGKNIGWWFQPFSQPDFYFSKKKKKTLGLHHNSYENPGCLDVVSSRFSHESYGFPMDFLWFSHGFPMVSPVTPQCPSPHVFAPQASNHPRLGGGGQLVRLELKDLLLAQCHAGLDSPREVETDHRKTIGKP